MKHFLVLIILFIFINGAESFDYVVIPNQSGYNTPQKSSISNEEFETLEKKIFNKTFKGDSSQKRLSRLEKEIFGMEQRGNEEERYENLLTASDYNYENKTYERNNDDAPQYYTYENTSKNKAYAYDIPKEDKQKPSKVKQFFADLAEALTSGVMTGYSTPVYYDIDPFAPNFIGYPSHATSFVNTPVYNHPSYHHRHYPYSPKATSPYNNYYPPPIAPPPVIPGQYPNPNITRRTYPYNNNYYPYGTGNKIYGSGARVRIID